MGRDFRPQLPGDFANACKNHLPILDLPEIEFPVLGADGYEIPTIGRIIEMA